MTDVWVCTNCKSINRRRDTRCYSCGLRQEEVAAEESFTPDLRLERAVANRAVRGYVPSWPFALAAGVLIAVVAVMGVWLVLETVRSIDVLRPAFVQAIRTSDSSALQPLLEEQARLAGPSYLRFGLQVLGFVAFGLWLSRVNLNIPALGGGVPTWGPAKAFVYTLIPIVNIIKIPGYIQDAMYRLDPRAGGFLMVLGALLLILGSWLVGVIGGIVIGGGFATSIAAAPTVDAAAEAFGSALDQTVTLSVITELMTAAGALLLVVIIGRVESRAIARDREIRAAFLGTPDGVPAPALWTPDPAADPSQAPAPVPATNEPPVSPDAAPLGYQPQSSVPVYRPQPVTPPEPVEPADPPLPPPPPPG